MVALVMDIEEELARYLVMTILAKMASMTARMMRRFGKWRRTPGVTVSPLVIEDLRTHMGNLEYSHGLLVKNVMTVSDAEVANGIAIREIRPRIEQDQQVITQRDEVISELSQQCILGLDKRLADVERRSLGAHPSNIYVGSDSRHLEIIMIRCTSLGTEDCNSWGNFGCRSHNTRMTSLRLDHCPIRTVTQTTRTEPIVEVEEQMVALVMDMEEELARYLVMTILAKMASMTARMMRRFGKWRRSTPGVIVSPLVIEDLRTHMGNLEYSHGLLMKNVMTVSDAEVNTQMEQDQQVITQRDEVIPELSQQCILGLDKRLADVERRYLGAHPSNIYVGSDSRHLEIIMIGCTSLGTEDCNSWGNFGCHRAWTRRHTRKSWKMLRWLDDEIPRDRIPTLKRDLLGVARFSRWVQAKVVSSKVE
nr:hypothetical protein [Tanacetum cinerariifolium]